jgi:zinc protease
MVLRYVSDPDEIRESLRATLPRHTCFVATPGEVTREFVASVHRLTRTLDADPYGDTIWGILTGFDAANALRIARLREPLIVKKVVSGTEVELQCAEEGVWYCELVQGRVVRKVPGRAPREEKGPADTTKALVDALNDYRPGLFVTSGHATERDWQIGYRYRNGQFRSQAGKLFGVDTGGRRYPVDSPNPKVYLPIGNCLMGHIDGKDAMALAFLNSAGVAQMIGYTVPTWYGYAGWGLLDYFLEQPGRYTLAEAFFANTQALIHRLETCFPEIAGEETRAGGTVRSVVVGEAARRAGLTANDGRGLLFDRDVVAFYGDPAWEARMSRGPLAWEQSLAEDDGVFTFEIRPRRGEATFEPINRNGSQRGGRPIVELLPFRVADVEILEGSELEPVVSDDFVLVPNPGRCEPERSHRVVFRARKVRRF